jgi:hypothetical protein
MLDNKNYNQFYCRIEIACCLKILLPEFKKEQCLIFSDYDVYAREFDDSESAISCIYEIEKAWNIADKLGETNNFGENKKCPSALIYNQQKNTLDIQMYLDKWRLSGISEYTYEWRDNIAKNKINNEYSQWLVAYTPCFDEVDEDEFISKKRVIQLINKWLETDDMSADFDRNQRSIYMEEIWGNKLDT